MAGGVALNSVANGRIIKETPFDDVYIQPAAGDSGGALGAALYAYHVLLGKPRDSSWRHAYWGARSTTGRPRPRPFLQRAVVAYERSTTRRSCLVKWPHG